MPSLSIKILPYYKNKPSGLFKEYDSGGLRVYYRGLGDEYSLPKKQNPIQKNRLVEVMQSFRMTPNSHRMRLLSQSK